MSKQEIKFYKRCATNVVLLYFWVIALVVLYIPYSIKMGYCYCKKHYAHFSDTALQ